MNGFTEKQFETKYGVIHYWTNSVETDAPALVFLPGVAADHTLFEKQLEFFAPTHRIVVWDAPAHGASRPFELAFSLMDEAEWLRAILAREGIDAPVLIGHSMGGHAAQCYIDKYPKHVAAFIAIGSTSLQQFYFKDFELRVLKKLDTLCKLLPWKTLVRSAVKKSAATEQGRALSEKMVSDYTAQECRALVSYGMRIVAEAVEAKRRYVVTCLAELICGEQDKLVTVKSKNREWALYADMPLYFIKNAGHNTPVDAPDAVNKNIGEFVDAVARVGKMNNA